MCGKLLWISQNCHTVLYCYSYITNQFIRFPPSFSLSTIGVFPHYVNLWKSIKKTFKIEVFETPFCGNRCVFLLFFHISPLWNSLWKDFQQFFHYFQNVEKCGKLTKVPIIKGILTV